MSTFTGSVVEQAAPPPLAHRPPRLPASTWSLPDLRFRVRLRASWPRALGNLEYMRVSAAAWPERTIVQEALAQIPWHHHIALLEKAVQVFGDPHLFDFLGTADRRREREVERALVDHLQRVLPGPAYGIAARSRGSSPKLQVLNTALMNAMTGLSPAEVRSDPEFRGRLVESAVGAHLANAAACGECELFYWRERGAEVDFVLRAAHRVTAIEVKSTARGSARPGIAAFAEAFKPQRTLLVGGDGIALDEFLARPVSHWVQA